MYTQKKMKIIFDFLVIFLLHCATNAATHSLKDFRHIFKGELCIEGNFNQLYLKHHKNEEDLKLEGILSLASVGTVEESEKPVLSRLNELAHYHQIDHYFTLEKEEGPPNARLFTISLTFGKEKYYGQGKSHKKAKQNAASKALDKTELEFPKIKNTTPGDIEKLTPTVLLNNLGSKLGIEITYYLLNKGKEEILHSNIVLTGKNKSYLKKLNDSIFLNKNLKIKREIESSKGPFQIKLKFGENIFHVNSHSIQSGRHEVASKALEFLAKNRDSLNLACLKEGSEAECKNNKDQLKSPISKVYEEAQKRKLDIEFEVMGESGPSHKKTFVTECRFGDMKTTGEATSKKESKRIAAMRMLEKIEEFDPFSTVMEVKNTNQIKKKPRKTKNKIIKNKFDEITMVLNNVGKTVTSFAKNLFSEDNQLQDIDSVDSNNENDNHIKKSTSSKQKRDTKLDNGAKSSQEELLELSNVLNFKVAFTDISEENKHISLLSLYTNPEYTCFGEDRTEFLARNVAAKNGLDLLSTIGVYDIFLEETGTALERETKEEIRLLISQEVLKDKEEL